jgi:hypothetical protein
MRSADQPPILQFDFKPGMDLCGGAGILFGARAGLGQTESWPEQGEQGEAQGS